MASRAEGSPDRRTRCAWARTDLSIPYHDTEWGVPVHDDRRFFELGDFRLESGNILPHARMLYVTYGRLNTARDNAVVTLSYHGGNHHGYDFLLGPAGGLDTTRYFVIATEMFGAGGSSSPSNTPTPYNGPRFSQTTIRDNVAAIPSPAAPRASSCSRSGSA